MAALIVIVAALGAAAVPLWRSHRVAERVLAGIPARPDLTGRPATLAQALSAAEALTTSNPTALEGAAGLGRLYHANGFSHEAEACWRLLQKEQPAEARWCYYVADLRRTESDYAGMAAFLVKTIELAPDYAPAWLRLAELQFKTGQGLGAEASYRKRLALVPGDAYARLGLARVALQSGQRDEARRLLARLVQDAPKFSTGHNLFGEMLAAEGDAAGADHQRWLGRETGRFREAADPWLDELQAWCYDYQRLCVLGTIDYQTERGDRGKSFFERAIRLRPDDLPAYELLGGLYLKLDDAAKARDMFELGQRQSPKSKPSAMFYVNLSHAYRMLKQPTEAVRVAREGLAQKGDEMELHDALGVALGDLGHHEEAVAELAAAVARNPNDSNSNYNLAVSLLELGRTDEAMAALKRALILQPTFPKALLLIGQMEMDAGRWESAGKYLRPLLESHPEMPEARQLMALWNLRAGTAAEAGHDLAAAETRYRDGLALDQRRAELQASLGALFLVQGRFPEAIVPLEAYHRLQPENPQGDLFLAEAYAATGRRDDARRLLTSGAEVAERTGNAPTAKHCREILSQLE